MSLGAVVIFVLGLEMWKVVKRRWALFAQDEVVQEDSLSIEKGLFTFTRSFPNFRTESDLEKKGG